MIWTLYDRLVARAQCETPVRRVLLGLSWSLAQVDAAGLCFSPAQPPRTLTFPGTLAGTRASDLAPWVRSFDPCEAAVGCAVINAVVNHEGNSLLRTAQPLANAAPPHLRVFANFTEQTRDSSVVVIGKYPGLDELWGERRYTCLERQATPGTLPDAAAEYILPRADWVFVTASAIANKTLPRLLELSRAATTVLMGPSVPWLEEWADFGVDYLAGVAVRDADRCWQIVGEGGGTRIFDEAVSYRLLRLK
jgi:uncharacterized protein (DUF4213/DUF364 family)